MGPIYNKRYTLLLLVFMSLAAAAQQPKVMNYQVVDTRKLHFGFTIGLNSFDFNFKRRLPGDSLFADEQKVEPGFNVNIVSEFRFNEAFSIRFLPGLVFGQRRIAFIIVKGGPKNPDYGKLYQPNPNNPINNPLTIESNYLDFPVLIKYRGRRVNNIRPYLIAGTSVRYDMAAKKNPKLDGTDIGISLVPLDIYGEIGFGMDFYLEYFKLSTEIKLSLGARDVLETNLQMAGVNGFSSKIVEINFHFE